MRLKNGRIKRTDVSTTPLNYRRALDYRHEKLTARFTRADKQHGGVVGDPRAAGLGNRSR